MTELEQKRPGWLFRRRLPLRLQADLLGRLAITLRAGIDLRKAWASEVQRFPARWRPRLNEATVALNNGEMLAEALTQTDLFSPLVLGMVAVGDQTGRDVDTLRELSRVLNHSVQTSRQLRASLVWPGFQLVLALGVVGLLIFLGGMIKLERGKPLDFIGLGLLGMSGLIQYGLMLLLVAAVAAISFQFLLASWRNHGLIRQLLNWVPLIGPAAQASEAASWSRAASLAAGAGLDAGRLVEMAGTVAPGLAVDARWIEDRLLVGDTLAEALAASRRFPQVLIEGIAVGESSGMVSEVLSRLSDQFADEARRGFEASAKAAGGGVWLAVAGLIILVIFRVFSVYVGMLQDAAGGI
jgi:type II secretory pathway component PulF